MFLNKVTRVYQGLPRSTSIYIYIYIYIYIISILLLYKVYQGPPGSTRVYDALEREGEGGCENTLAHRGRII